MVKNRPGWEFPSGLENEIEQPLRRGFKKEKEVPIWVLIIVMIVVATLAYFVVGRVVDDQAHASYNAHKDLCDRYLNDSSLNGTSAQETLNKICL